MRRYMCGTKRPDMFVCDMRKRSNLHLASKKEQMVRVEKTRKSDCLTIRLLISCSNILPYVLRGSDEV